MTGNNRVISCDLGTMFFQVAEIIDGKVQIKTTRNVFVELSDSDDIDDVLKQNKWQYVKDGNKYYVIGEDALRVAKMFPGKVELRRPMQDGVLNKGEDKKLLIVNELIESSIGKSLDTESVVCTCISSQAVDDSPDSTFHKARLQGIFKRLGWNVKIIEEGLAVVFAEKPIMITKDEEGKETEVPYTGLGISVGAGKTNCVLAYKGLQVLGISCRKSGDWIDQKVSEQTDIPISQVISRKEKDLDFTNLDYNDDVLFALDAYYGSMIEYVFSNFAKKFAEVKSQFDAPLEIVVAGGSSLPKGFCNKVWEVIKKMELPFEIKGIRAAVDPRNSVVKGLLTQALLFYKKNFAKSEKK